MDERVADTAARALARAFRPALALLLLTAAHHAYGACVYHTPWRLQVAAVAAATALMLWGALRVIRHRPAGRAAVVAVAAFCLVDAVMPVLGIGVFEGGYNHVLKDALFFAGASPSLMAKLFPPPAYELPNDMLFEVSGILQFVVGLMAGYRLYRLVRHGWRSRAGAPVG